jgi:hypothetical protein
MQASFKCHKVKRIDKEGKESLRKLASSVTLARVTSSVTHESWVADAPSMEPACRPSQTRDPIVVRRAEPARYRSRPAREMRRTRHRPKRKAMSLTERTSDGAMGGKSGSSGIDVGDHTGLNRSFSLQGNGCGRSLTVC